MKKLSLLFAGSTLSSFAIACIINSGLGCFSITATNLALANWFHSTIGITGMIVELIILSLATYRGEGIGVTSIVNATYGSLMIDVFRPVIPTHPIMVVGLLLIPVAWSLMGRASLGDTGSNLLMNSIVKSTGKSVGLIRGIQECVFMFIGFLGARSYVTWFTIALSLGLGYLLQFEYKFLNYNPIDIRHSFIIKRPIKGE